MQPNVFKRATAKNLSLASLHFACSLFVFVPQIREMLDLPKTEAEILHDIEQTNLLHGTPFRCCGSLARFVSV